MEYIKKEDLIVGEVYKHDNGNLVQYLDTCDDYKIYGHFIGDNRSNFTTHYKAISPFKIGQLKIATTEEKHWLEECIKLDRFITFEEAMKSFGHEYVECIKEGIYNFYGKLGTIYKVNNWNHSTADCMLEGTTSGSTSKNRFKPSTKEAYDAQFVVKEPEFVLPEKWCILRTPENYKIINDWFMRNQTRLWVICNNDGYLHSTVLNSNWINNNYKNGNHTEITFDQFKKYVLKEEIVEEIKVIEPLPKFKVIETIEIITKVENNEGNQFFIGDVVKSLDSDQKGTITKFRYSADKSNIIAITTFQSNNGIGIDKIEHYIEPKIEETLSDKAKRLYPIGTKFKSSVSGKLFTIKDHIQEICCNHKQIVFGTIEATRDGHLYGCVHSNNNGWAEVIKYPHDFKIGDKITSKYGNDVYKITKIEGNQLIFETNSLPKINSILVKNVIKVN
jgi:hypothetical protein